MLQASVPRADADEWAARLALATGRGVEVRDDTTLARAPRGRAVLVASFASRSRAQAARSVLPATARVRLDRAARIDWRRRWRRGLGPRRLAPGLVLAPPWVALPRRWRAERVVRIDLAGAFGTGVHASTRLALRLMARAIDLRRRSASTPAVRVLDVGTGSGILAIAARKLGASRVVAIDTDPLACEEARRNVRRNRVRRIDVACSGPEGIDGRFDVVVANLSAPVLSECRTALLSRLAPAGTLVLAGLLAPQTRRVGTTFAPLRRLAECREREWVALSLRSDARSGDAA